MIRAITAGAYVLLNGRFPFMVGPTEQGDALAVVRLGGHCEPGETSWDCAAREVYEEASLQIRPLAPPQIYWIEGDSDAIRLEPGAWCGDPAVAVPPLLIVKRSIAVSFMYLAHAIGEPVPAAETRGLPLLSPADVLRVARTPLTLDDYLQAGGRALLRETLPTHLPLAPFLQLRCLATLLE